MRYWTVPAQKEERIANEYCCYEKQIATRFCSVFFLY